MTMTTEARRGWTERALAFIKGRTWPERMQGDAPTVRELARRYRVSQREVVDALESHDSVSMSVGFRGGGGAWGHGSAGDHSFEWTDDDTVRPSRATLQAALRAARDAADTAEGLVRGRFPVGAKVQWSHGDGVRSGVVTHASGIRLHKLRFRIRSDAASGRMYWVDAGRLLSFVGL